MVLALKRVELPSRSEKSGVQGVRSVGCHDHFHLIKNFLPPQSSYVTIVYD